MFGRLPVFVDLKRYADQGVMLEGELELSKMSRLLESLTSDEGSIKVAINFGIDEQRIRYMRIEATAELMLRCQRCMQPVEQQVVLNSALGLISSEAQAERLTGEYEPFLIPDAQTAIAEIIEDELILALPIVPRHADQLACAPVDYSSDDAEQEKVVEQEEKVNPFAALSDLKKH